MEEAAFVAGDIAIKSYSEDIHRAKRTGSCDRSDPDVARKAYDGVGAAFARLY